MTNIKRIIKPMIFYVLKFMGWFIPQEKNVWFCIPNAEVKTAPLDLLNYTYDCVHSLIHYIIISNTNENLKMKLVIFSMNRHDKIMEFINSYKKAQIKLVYFDISKGIQKIKYYFSFYSSKFILCHSIWDNEIFYKLKKQTTVCINYYMPFKLNFKNINTKNLNYIIMSSNIGSQISAFAYNISHEKYLSFGLPKEDSIITPRFVRNEIYQKLKLPDNINKLVLYVPTHRDYENINTFIKKRSVFGYDGDYNSLNENLKFHKAILIIKLHPGQQKEHIFFYDTFSNIQLYQPSYEYNICDILPHTDLLITDYSSVSFDFMLTGKPIIYNFFDKEIYEKTRGFSWDPVEIVCAGPIVKTKEELENEINNCLLYGNIKFKEKYEWVSQLTHAYSDGNSNERIFSFIKQLTNKHVKNTLSRGKNHIK